MKRYRPIHLLYTTLILLALISSTAQGQKLKGPSYDLVPIKAIYVDTLNPKEIILFFHYSTKRKKDFKLIASLRFSYTLGDQAEENIVVVNTENKHNIIVYGASMKEKAPNFYNLIKDKVDFDSTNRFHILVFRLKGLTEEYVDKMSFTYGLWEPSNTGIRFEQKHLINIDK